MVDRYESSCMHGEPHMDPNDKGEWVMFTDYAALKSELAEAQERLADVQERNIENARKSQERLAEVSRLREMCGEAAEELTTTLKDVGPLRGLVFQLKKAAEEGSDG